MSFGPTALDGFYNSLAIGQSAGNNFMDGFLRGRAMRQERDERNALAAFVTNPNEQTAAAVAPFQPKLAYDYAKDERERTAKANLAGIAQQALAGNNQALGQLFTLDNDLWKRLDDRQREGVKAATSFMAQRGMEIGRLPEAQRSEAWAASVRQAETMGIDIPTYMEAYTPDVLNAALARAEMTEKYIQQFDPDFRVIPQGGYLEDVNPITGVNSQQPASQGVSVGTFYGVFDVQGPQGAVAWSMQNPVRVTTPQEAASLPRGTRIILPDGSEGRVP